jgi:hypothetical protein
MYAYDWKILSKVSIIGSCMLIERYKWALKRPLKTLVSLKEPSGQLFRPFQFYKKATYKENGRGDEHLATVLSCFLWVWLENYRIIFYSHIWVFLGPSRPLYGQSRLWIFHGHQIFKTATFEESGRDDGHLATLPRPPIHGLKPFCKWHGIHGDIPLRNRRFLAWASGQKLSFDNPFILCVIAIAIGWLILLCNCFL